MDNSTKQTWSTIKFPKEFVCEIGSYSKENGWNSSSEFLIAAKKYVLKYQIDLHGESSPFTQTIASQMFEYLKSVSEALKTIPERIKMAEEINQLKIDLIQTRNDLERVKKSLAAWKTEALTQKGQKKAALENQEKLRKDVSTITEKAQILESLLNNISGNVKNSLQELETEKSWWRRQSKKLRMAVATLEWILSEADHPP